MMTQPDLDLHQKLSRAISALGADSSHGDCAPRSRKRAHSSLEDVSPDFDVFGFPDRLSYVDDLVGNDLWVKFELTCTPPLSPQRPNSPDFELHDFNEDLSRSGLTKSSKKPFPITPPDSDISDGDTDTGDESSVCGEKAEVTSLVTETVLKDCMWSCTRVPANALGLAPPHSNRLSSNGPASSLPKVAGTASASTDVNHSLANSGDESALFPFPLNSQGIYNSARKFSLSSTDGEEELDSATDSHIGSHSSQKTVPTSSSCVGASNVVFRPPGPPIPLSVLTDTPPSTPCAGTPDSEYLFNSPSTSSSAHHVLNARPSRQMVPPASPALDPAAKRIRRDRTPPSRLTAPVEDDDPEIKRATHNVLERRRREDLKIMYTNLRRCLPDLEMKDKAAKVKILERANSFIQHLVREKSNLDDDFKVLQRRNCQLRQVLSSRRAMKA